MLNVPRLIGSHRGPHRRPPRLHLCQPLDPYPKERLQMLRDRLQRKNLVKRHLHKFTHPDSSYWMPPEMCRRRRKLIFSTMPLLGQKLSKHRTGGHPTKHQSLLGVLLILMVTDLAPSVKRLFHHRPPVGKNHSSKPAASRDAFRRPAPRLSDQSYPQSLLHLILHSRPLRRQSKSRVVMAMLQLQAARPPISGPHPVNFPTRVRQSRFPLVHAQNVLHPLSDSQLLSLCAVVQAGDNLWGGDAGLGPGVIQPDLLHVDRL